MDMGGYCETYITTIAEHVAWLMNEIRNVGGGKDSRCTTFQPVSWALVEDNSEC